MPFLLSLLLFVAAGGQGCSGPLRAQPRAADHIGFVRLAVTDSSVAVLETATTPGRLKAPRGRPAAEAFTFDLVGGDGAVVWTAGFDDPLVERQEYVGDDGQLHTRFVRLARAEVTLRMPAAPGTYRLVLYGAAAAKQAGRPVLGRVAVTF